MILLMLTLSPVSHADDQDVIDYRVHIMASLEEELAALEQMIQAKIPAAAFPAHAKALWVIAATAKSSFAPKLSGGGSKPTVWSNWTDFSKRLDGMIAVAAELAKAAESAQGIPDVAKNLENNLGCKSCHEAYREDKK